MKRICGVLIVCFVLLLVGAAKVKPQNPSTPPTVSDAEQEKIQNLYLRILNFEKNKQFKEAIDEANQDENEIPIAKDPAKKSHIDRLTEINGILETADEWKTGDNFQHALPLIQKTIEETNFIKLPEDRYLLAALLNKRKELVELKIEEGKKLTTKEEKEKFFTALKENPVIKGEAALLAMVKEGEQKANQQPVCLLWDEGGKFWTEIKSAFAENFWVVLGLVFAVFLLQQLSFFLPAKKEVKVHISNSNAVEEKTKATHYEKLFIYEYNKTLELCKSIPGLSKAFLPTNEGVAMVTVTDFPTESVTGKIDKLLNKSSEIQIGYFKISPNALLAFLAFFWRQRSRFQLSINQNEGGKSQFFGEIRDHKLRCPFKIKLRTLGDFILIFYHMWRKMFSPEVNLQTADTGEELVRRLAIDAVFSIFPCLPTADKDSFLFYQLSRRKEEEIKADPENSEQHLNDALSLARKSFRNDLSNWLARYQFARIQAMRGDYHSASRQMAQAIEKIGQENLSTANEFNRLVLKSMSCLFHIRTGEEVETKNASKSLNNITLKLNEMTTNEADQILANAKPHFMLFIKKIEVAKLGKEIENKTKNRTNFFKLKNEYPGISSLSRFKIIRGDGKQRDLTSYETDIEIIINELNAVSCTEEAELENNRDRILADLYNTQGYLFSQKVDHQKAIIAYKTAISYDPDLTTAYLNLAEEYLSTSSPDDWRDQAENALLTALYLNPKNSPVLLKLARFYLHEKVGRKTEIYNYLKFAVTKEESATNSAELPNQMNYFQKALASMERTITPNQKDIENRLLYAQIVDALPVAAEEKKEKLVVAKSYLDYLAKQKHEYPALLAQSIDEQLKTCAEQPAAT